MSTLSTSSIRWRGCKWRGRLKLGEAMRSLGGRGAGRTTWQAHLELVAVFYLYLQEQQQQQPYICNMWLPVTTASNAIGVISRSSQSRRYLGHSLANSEHHKIICLSTYNSNHSLLSRHIGRAIQALTQLYLMLTVAGSDIQEHSSSYVFTTNAFRPFL
jgi:hypothetical protein